eukprot:1918956-Karenia_brevis.AAC.1
MAEDGQRSKGIGRGGTPWRVREVDTEGHRGRLRVPEDKGNVSKLVRCRDVSFEGVNLRVRKFDSDRAEHLYRSFLTCSRAGIEQHLKTKTKKSTRSLRLEEMAYFLAKKHDA